MTDRPLPDFSRPPVAEVVLSVAFSPVEGLDLIHLGLLWSEVFSHRFPIVREQPRWEMPREQFGSGGFLSAPSFEILPGIPTPRVWLEDEGGKELIQIQRDWFGRNWRKREEADVYPRYPQLREPFQGDLRAFVEFVESKGLGKFVPEQCEVTYINHIVPGKVWQSHKELPQVLALADRPEGEAFLSDPEQMRVGASYLIAGEDAANPVGRLHVTTEPAFRRTDESPMLVLTLTARGLPLGEGVEGVMGFLDLGREWVVRGFADVTTPQMHEEWGRVDAT